jgi:putative glutamine amidotransferase
VTGRYEDDTVEALEDPARPFVLGVLWYPDEDENSQLIKALVSEVF